MANLNERKNNFPTEMNLEEIIRSFQSAQDEVISFYKSIPTETFFEKPKSGWSPAENIRHLTSSVLPVAIFLKKEFITLLNFFGKPEHKRTFKEIVNTYLHKIGSGAGSGVFTPFSLSFIRTPEWQELECNTLSELLNQLGQNISNWTELEIDSTAIIHPILGLISVREMLYFTYYHLYHHSCKVELRLNHS